MSVNIISLSASTKKRQYSPHSIKIKSLSAAEAEAKALVAKKKKDPSIEKDVNVSKDITIAYDNLTVCQFNKVSLY